jgi:hypothetical protein
VDTPAKFARTFEDFEGRQVDASWSGNRVAGILTAGTGQVPFHTGVQCLLLAGIDGPAELNSMIAFHGLLATGDAIVRKGGKIPARFWADTYHRFPTRPCVFVAISVDSEINVYQNIQVITFVNCFSAAYFRLSGVA